MVKNLPNNAGDARDWCSISESSSRRSPGVGNGNPLQYSCLAGYCPQGHKESDKTEHTHKKKILRHEKIPNVINEISLSIVQSKTVYILRPGSGVCLNLTLSLFYITLPMCS